MAEKSAEEIMAAQLDYDAAEAKLSVVRAIINISLNPERARAIADAIEAFVGRLVMRWWFARIKRNRETVLREDQKQTEARRRARAAVYIACCQSINAKTGVGQNGPSTVELQMALLDLTASMRALWQVAADAGIVDPNAKQDYLDAGAAEIWNQVEQHGSTLAPARAGTPRRN